MESIYIYISYVISNYELIRKQIAQFVVDRVIYTPKRCKSQAYNIHRNDLRPNDFPQLTWHDPDLQPFVISRG